MISASVSPKELKRRIRNILPEIREIRRNLHRIPETKLEEQETSKRIREQVAATSIELLPPYLGTDVVGLLWGSGPGDPEAGVNVTLRADIDALPIEEKSGKPWRSGHEGRAHACGHDGHTAILIGALKVLDGLKDHFSGSVRFVFQPAEEEAGGGQMMVAKGLLDSEPRPQAVFALHGWPGTPVGSIAARPGAAMAAADRFRLVVRGRGGHGAVPHKAVDPVLASAQIITALQSVVSRSINPVTPSVLSVCTIHGGQTSNVIPDEVSMEGTTRFFEKRMQSQIRGRMEKIISGTCAAAGASFSFEYLPGYIPLVNDEALVRLLVEVTEDYLGKEAWVPDLPPAMGAEDFAYYLDRVPGVFFRLGLGEDSPVLHSSEFDFNDQALENGITMMCALALETLSRAPLARTPRCATGRAPLSGRSRSAAAGPETSS